MSGTVRSPSRGGISTIRPSSTTTIVSDDGTATATASASSRAATHSAMIRPSTNGRAASWKSTRASSGSVSSADSAHSVESVRLAPPSITPVTFVYGAGGRARRRPGGREPSPRGLVDLRSGVERGDRAGRIGRPPTEASCLGASRPSRRPVPPARTTAVVVVVFRSALICPNSTVRVRIGSRATVTYGDSPTDRPANGCLRRSGDRVTVAVRSALISRGVRRRRPPDPKDCR